MPWTKFSTASSQHRRSRHLTLKPSVITFGNATNNVETTAQLNTKLQALIGGVSASAAQGANGLSFSLAAGPTNTLGLSTSTAGLRDILGPHGRSGRRARYDNYGPVAHL